MHLLTIKKLQRCLVVLSLLILSGSALAIGNIETFMPKGETSVVIKSEFLEDVAGVLDIEDVQSSSGELPWQVVLEEYANFGYQPHAFWYRFEISNPASKTGHYIIELAYALLDEVDFYQFGAQGELLTHVQTGDHVPYHSRVVDHPNFLFPIQLQPNETHTFYLRVKTAGSQLVPLKLWDNIALFSSLSNQDELHAVYFGIVLVIVFLNSLIFIALREKMYLYYALSTFFFMLLFAVLRGKLYPYVLSDSPSFHHMLLLFLPPLCLMFSALFTREFLEVRKYSRFLNAVVNLVVLVSLVCMLGIFVLDRQTSLQLSVLCAIPGTALLLLFGPILSWLGNRIAWVYTLAWGILMAGATVTAMSKHGFIPANFATEYGMQIGSAIEIFILTAALVYRFYREHRDRIAAQARSIQESNERREAELKLLDSSMTHPVTMMPNRVCFEQTITQHIRNSRREFAICIVESRRYAEIVKTLGQQNVDLMICDMAKRYNTQLGKVPGILPILGPSFEANICSLEGGSFGFMMDYEVVLAHQSEVETAARTLRKPVAYKDMLLDFRPRIGVALYPEHGANVSTLMRHAEVAADYSEHTDHMILFYRPEQDQYNARRLTMISELKQAIANDKLVLYFQPKFDIASRKVTGVEALVRWNHDQYGLVRPDEFIGLAEQTGIIKRLTRWVYDEALQNCKRLQLAGYDLTMSINISALNLKEKDLIKFFQRTTEAAEIDAGKLILEVTETSMMANPELALETLAAFRQSGFNISVDDFGSGYSSLSYLKDLPAHEIKIDKSLISGMIGSERSESVVRKTIDMCHDLGFRVVAEGVETQEMMDNLVMLHCDQIQGYLLTPPLPLHRLIEWLQDQETTRRFAS